jgi:hypothetical protein
MRTVLLAAALSLVAASGCAKDKPSAEQVDEYPKMSLDEVEKGIAANVVTAIDCNGERTRKKLGVVPGAVVISDEETYPVSELPADKARRLVFYCSDAG